VKPGKAVPRRRLTVGHITLLREELERPNRPEVGFAFSLVPEVGTVAVARRSTTSFALRRPPVKVDLGFKIELEIVWIRVSDHEVSS